jgi:uncharacterized membrane protein YccF (DUF307 family)
MRLIGNVLWVIFGGLEAALAWMIAGMIMFISIVGIPFGKACFTIAAFSFMPFGKKAVDRSKLTGRRDVGTGPLGVVGNVIWFLLCGWWLALLHLAFALLLAVTIIGLPGAYQHVKLAGISLFPIGKAVVDLETARHLRE